MFRHCICLLFITIVPVEAWAGTTPDSVEERLKVKPFDLSAVRLEDGPFKAAQELDRKYLMSMEPDRLLWCFRANAALPTPGEPLGGWEAPTCDVRGHFVGNYVSALALMYAGTGDEAVKERGDFIVSEWAQVQSALGGGYLSAFPASVWDAIEKGERNWARYYTIHKIMAGLWDQYRYCGNEQALDVLEKEVDYFVRRLEKLSNEQMDSILKVSEEGGWCDVLWQLYALTKKEEYRTLAEKFERRVFIEPLAHRQDKLTGLHGNTHIPLIVGAAQRYEVTGDVKYRDLTEWFWKRVVEMRTYATGGTTLWEIWPKAGELADTLGYRNQECCKTYNLLKVTRHLFSWTGEAQYADYYERALFNSVLGTQEHEQGLLMYYIPLKRGFLKSVLSHSEHCYCCTGTGLESHAKLADSIYFHDKNALYVNLFIASTVNWTEKQVRLTQQTEFPKEEGTRLNIHTAGPVSMTLKVRIPYWCRTGAVIKVNGQPVEADVQPSSYVHVERTWQDGDVVEMQLPMGLHIQTMPDDPEMAAVMYGPLVLAGLTQDSENKEPYLIPPKKEFPESEDVRMKDYDFRCLYGDIQTPSDWLRPVEGKTLTFKTTGQEENITFVPFNQITGERYAVYWVVTHPGSDRDQQMHQAAAERNAQEQEKQRRLARRVDSVIPGHTANEMLDFSEAAHHYQGENSQTGRFQDKQWRHAKEGWWSWDLAVEPQNPMVLACTYWGDDVGQRTFDILVNGEKIATQTLNRDRPGDFFIVEYPIPHHLTADKKTVTVLFRSHPGCFAGGVFQCDMLKAE